MVYGLHSDTSSTHPGYFSLSAGEVWPRNISSERRTFHKQIHWRSLRIRNYEENKQPAQLQTERTELREEEKDDINSLFKEKMESKQKKQPYSEDNGRPAITALWLSSGRVWMLSSYISSQINLRRVQDAQLCSFLILLKQQKQDQNDLKHNVQVGLQRRRSRR